MGASKRILAAALCWGLVLGFALLGCGDTASNCERACIKIYDCSVEDGDRTQFVQDCTSNCIDNDSLEGCEAVCDSSPGRPCEDFRTCLDACLAEE